MFEHFLLLPLLVIIGYFLVNILGALISEGRLWPEKEEDGSVGAIGLLTLLVFVPSSMVMFGISKEYYWHAVIVIIIAANYEKIRQRIFKQMRKSFTDDSKSRVEIKSNTVKVLTDEPLPKKRHCIVTECDNTVLNSSNQIETKKEIYLAGIRERNDKSFITIDQNGWIYIASENRLYNPETGEDLYSSQGLGFSIGLNYFLLYNKSTPRKILKSLVRHE